MLTEAMFVDILVLHQQGMSARKIARKLGLSRNTVKKYLTQNRLPHYSSRAASKSKIDPFKAYVQQRIEAAKPDWIPAVVLLREIKAQGYCGEIGTLRNYIRPFKNKVIEPVVRFETPPGKQLQIDFTTITHGKLCLKAFVATLGYSRATFVKFYPHERSEAWQDGIISAFEYFGGVTQEVLCDNAKAMIIKRDAYGEGEHQWQAQMRQLAKDYHFQLKACRPYRAKTKGKVERFNHYLKNSFIVPLKAELKQQGLLLDVALANGKIGQWLQEVANERIHGTTQEKPCALLAQELPHLQPLPAFVVEKSETITLAPPINLQHAIDVYDALLEEPSHAAI